MRAAQFPSRRKLLTGAAALAAYAALGTEPVAAAPFVVGAQSSGTTGLGTTSAKDTTGANFIAISQSFYWPASAGGPPTDSKSNTWTLGKFFRGTNFQTEIWYCFNPTVGSGHTFSGPNCNNGTLCVAAYSGASGAAGATATGSTTTSTTIQPGSITPAQTNTLLISSIVSADSISATYAIDSGFAIRATVAPASGLTEGGALADLLQGAPAATNPIWSGVSSSAEIAAVMIQVPMASGPPTGNNHQNLLLLGVG